MTTSRLKMAYVMHPMVLIVHEDRGEPVVGERVGPWGAPDLPTYAERVRRNLQALERYPDLRLNYEFSGVELEMLAEVAPDTIATMREMVDQGRLAFVGGDYSQPHGHLYSGELNFRQLEFGLRVFGELVGYRVTCAFHQETCTHDQMPQLLRGLGFESAVAPDSFTYSIIPLSLPGPCLIGCGRQGLRPLAKDSTPDWRGLDGTEIPLVIPGIFAGDEYHKGLYRLSDLCVFAPDMDEVSEERMGEVRSVGEFVLLDSAALDESTRHPATWKARLFSFWSYSEGEWAEAVCRGIRSAEAQLVAEETVSALYGPPARADLDPDWRTLLASMHHDVHWIEVTDLKRLYSERLETVILRSQEHVASLVGASGSAFREPRSASSASVKPDEVVHAINPLPLPRSEVVTLRGLRGSPVQVLRADGTPAPSQCVPSQDGADQYDLYFLAEVPPCGIASYALTGEGATMLTGAAAPEVSCQTADARYAVAEDGTVREAMLPDGTNVLRGPGHDLHYLELDGTLRGGPGRSGSLRHFRGPVGEVIRVEAPVGDVPSSIEFLASPAVVGLNITTRFDFDRHLIGVMWEDWTKLNAYWPTVGQTIRHDIPYGVTDGMEKLPLYASSWLSVFGSEGGLALINTGMPKHYVEDGTIANVLAWGRKEYSNRLQGSEEWVHAYDLSLSGAHYLRSAAVAMAAGHSEVHIARRAQCVNHPVLVFGAARASEPPIARWSLDLSRTSLISSALFLRDDRPVCRFWESGGGSQGVEELSEALGMKVDVTDLAGEPLEVIAPYRIGHLLLPPLE